MKTIGLLKQKYEELGYEIKHLKSLEGFYANRIFKAEENYGRIYEDKANLLENNETTHDPFIKSVISEHLEELESTVKNLCQELEDDRKEELSHEKNRKNKVEQRNKIENHLASLGILITPDPTSIE